MVPLVPCLLSFELKSSSGDKEKILRNFEGRLMYKVFGPSGLVTETRQEVARERLYGCVFTDKCQNIMTML